MPFHDPEDDRVEDVAIVCDDEGKMKRSMMNRVILNENGEIVTSTKTIRKGSRLHLRLSDGAADCMFERVEEGTRA